MVATYTIPFRYRIVFHLSRTSEPSVYSVVFARVVKAKLVRRIRQKTAVPTSVFSTLN